MVSGIDFGRLIGKTDSSALSPEVRKYNERRFRQMSLFYGCALATFICSKVAYRGVISRRYLPNFYQHNHVPPSFSFYRDALSAVTHGSLLAVSTFSMIITGSLWYFDISNAREFSFKLRNLLGGEQILEIPNEGKGFKEAMSPIMNALEAKK
ncbi:unnamed protein product [Kuraishia capsulata CBS 1993]|uniref:Altered inheritance of mitochondria protein 11 n=1 Tax=Kuraishia capsulata CBS 1993 TaxID=1382522 RepID=W6MH38_9ASCO|nr:uncharacterized protein KUCA_T00001479001 [Kuraishia capsulata CBS 1993]CDK25509.1 unnamed protein product [Kuraishia capsulata CBS 1993]